MPASRGFYEIEAIQNRWTARELERQINSLLFERLAKSKDKKGLMKLATKGQEITKPADIFKDPVVIEFLGLPESPKLVESDLETALLDNLQAFLLELGKSFAFISRQERLTLEGDHFYIDLVFYHVILKCYILIDLKVGKLTHSDLGQLQLYVNYFNEERRTPGDNPTLGLILCTDKNDAVVKYTLGPQGEAQIFASRYQLHLPTEDELRQEVRRELRTLTCSTTAASPRKTVAVRFDSTRSCHRKHVTRRPRVAVWPMKNHQRVVSNKTGEPRNLAARYLATAGRSRSGRQERRAFCNAHQQTVNQELSQLW